VQHPFGQLVALHAHVPLPVSQATPLPHATHAAPPVPHWLADCDEYGTHAPLAVQHPWGQDVASHPQPAAPLKHSCPDAHDPHAAPPVPQDAFVCDP
jgi:hypothetical protein